MNLSPFHCRCSQIDDQGRHHNNEDGFPQGVIWLGPRPNLSPGIRPSWCEISFIIWQFKWTYNICMYLTHLTLISSSQAITTTMPLSLEVTFAAYLAVLLGTFVPVTFLIVLYSQVKILLSWRQFSTAITIIFPSPHQIFNYDLKLFRTSLEWGP